ncbi:Ig-like domain-containing protein [Sporosarcina ureae]|uniref:RCC1 domain-containing protein n=1 Tax=Sporosarcina ureae TaxID=1571 RepID=UPI0026E98738|nr:Ig-like domain-containing protein [Sporosarcina ureae]
MFTKKSKYYLLVTILIVSIFSPFIHIANAYGIVSNHESVVDAGKEHLIVLRNDGSVWSWGENTFGQLGGNSAPPTRSVAPKAIQLENGNRLLNIKAIAAGGYHSVALDSKGNVWTWGSNTFKQLGHSPKNAINENPEMISGLSNIVAIAAGDYHSLAVDDNGHVWSWGRNKYGQVGMKPDKMGETIVPERIASLNGIIAVSAGSEHSVALQDNGNVWTWGSNEYGQLGNGETTNINFEPKLVPGLTSIMEISAGNNHTVALKQDRTSMFAWGSNSYGQLGDGGREMKLLPVLLEGIQDIKNIAAGDNHTSVIKEDGSVWAWGRNTSGIASSRTTPIRINGLDQAIAIGSGGYIDSFILAIKSDGTVWQWDSASSDSTTKLPIFKKVSGIENVMKLDEFPFVQGGQVKFKYIGNSLTEDVKLNGSFNNNIDLQMERKEGNVWELQVELQPGQYEYGFRVNGEWKVDPLNRRKMIDDFGRTFSVLKVAPYVTVGPLIDNKDVTFSYSSFDFNNQLELTANSKSVSVMGNFGENYHWIEIPMVKQPNNIWTVTRTLKPRDYYYSFVVRDNDSQGLDEKRNDPLNLGLQTDVLTGITRNTFTVAENILTRIPVASIAINKGSDMDLIVGEQSLLTARISPSNATNQNVNWNSSKPTVASVEGGRITAHSAGVTTITVASVDGGKIATMTVAVTRQEGAVSYPRVGYKTEDDRFNVEPTKAWKINLSQELDIKTFNPESVYVLNESGVQIPLGYQVSNKGTTMELRLQNGYKYEKGANYYLFIEDTVKSSNGVKLKNKVQMKFQIKL